MSTINKIKIEDTIYDIEDIDARNELKNKASISEVEEYIEEHKDELKGADGKDGIDGKDGYTPVKGVDYFDGKDGADGKDGYTPVKGVDYFDGTDGVDGKDGKDGVSGVYVGSGDMPDDCNVQIDPDGEVTVMPTKTSQLENDNNFVDADYVNTAIQNALEVVENGTY